MTQKSCVKYVSKMVYHGKRNYKHVIRDINSSQKLQAKSIGSIFIIWLSSVFETVNPLIHLP